MERANETVHAAHKRDREIARRSAEFIATLTPILMDEYRHRRFDRGYGNDAAVMHIRQQVHKIGQEIERELIDAWATEYHAGIRRQNNGEPF